MGGAEVVGVSTVAEGLEKIGIKEPKKKLKQAFDPRNLLDFPDPEAIDLPDFPEDDAAADLIKRRILAERIRRATVPGPGRRATIATSPRGVLGPTPLTRRTLTGA
jgi:hypothetical protein